MPIPIPTETNTSTTVTIGVKRFARSCAGIAEKLKGNIIEVVEKGYKLGDKIIRFPKVIIGQ